MTKRQLWMVTLSITAFYLGAMAVGVCLRIADPNSKDGLLYSTYKDLLPLIIATPAAYLAYAFQRRNSYMQTLRTFWTNLVVAIQAARTYTYAPNPTYEQYTQTLEKLSIIIDEARGVFCNLHASGSDPGWYPFEPIKEIYDDIRDLGFGGNVCRAEQERVRRSINARWKLVRAQLLREYDRPTPTYHYSWYTALRQQPADQLAQSVDGQAVSTQTETRA